MLEYKLLWTRYGSRQSRVVSFRLWRAEGGARHHHSNESSRILPSRRYTSRARSNQRMYRGNSMLRDALQAYEREYEQGCSRGVLSGSRNQAHRVSVLKLSFHIQMEQTGGVFAPFLLARILHKHIKRQIISLNGGFQMIADLNAYHSFISSLKVCTSF
jgi:hypothetical protein